MRPRPSLVARRRSGGTLRPEPEPTALPSRIPALGCDQALGRTAHD